MARAPATRPRSPASSRRSPPELTAQHVDRRAHRQGHGLGHRTTSSPLKRLILPAIGCQQPAVTHGLHRLKVLLSWQTPRDQLESAAGCWLGLGRLEVSGQVSGAQCGLPILRLKWADDVCLTLRATFPRETKCPSRLLVSAAPLRWEGFYRSANCSLGIHRHVLIVGEMGLFSRPQLSGWSCRPAGRLPVPEALSGGALPRLQCHSEWKASRTAGGAALTQSL